MKLELMEGIIQHIDFRKRYGFIAYGGGQTIFFHFSQKRGRLAKGDQVQFDIRPSKIKKGGNEAIDIRLLRSKDLEERYVGRIKSYHAQKGQGAIQLQEEEVFFNKSALRRYLRLSLGDLVTFSMAYQQERKEAQNILRAPSESNLYILNDKTLTKGQFLAALGNSSVEEAISILDQQHTYSALMAACDHIMERLNSSIDGTPDTPPGDALLRVLIKKEAAPYILSKISRWLQNNTSIESQFAFWLAHGKLYSEALLNYLTQEAIHFDDTTIGKILSKKNSEASKAVLKPIIEQYFPIDTPAAYSKVKSYLKKITLSRPEIYDLDFIFEDLADDEDESTVLDEAYEDLLSLREYARDHATPFFKCHFFLDELCSDIEPELLLQHLEHFSIEEIFARKDETVNEALARHLLAPHLPIKNEQAYEEVKKVLSLIKKNHQDLLDLEEVVYEQASPSFQYQLFADYYYPHFPAAYVRENITRFSAEEISRLLRVSEDPNYKLELLTSLLPGEEQEGSHIEEISAHLERARQHLPADHYRKFESSAVQYFSEEEKYRAWRDKQLVHLNQQLLCHFFIKGSTEERKDILRRVSKDKELFLLESLLQQWKQVDDPETYTTILALLQESKPYYHPNDQFEPLLTYFAPYYQFRLWIDGLTNRLDAAFIRANIHLLSQDEVAQILEKGDDDSRSSVIRRTVKDLSGRPFTKEGLDLFISQLEHLSDKQKRKDLIVELLPGLDRLYHFHLWLEDAIKYSDDILEIYHERKEEIGYYSTSIAISKNIETLNDQVFQDQIQGLHALEQPDDYYKRAASLSSLLWQYRTSKPETYFQVILERLPISKIYHFGNDIIAPLSKKYTYSGSYQGTTFLYIYYRNPEYIAVTNEQYGEDSIFHYGFTYLDGTLFERRVRQLDQYIDRLISVQAAIHELFQIELSDTSEQIDFLLDVQQFEDSLRSLEGDFDTVYSYQLESLLKTFLTANHDLYTRISLFAYGLIDDFDLPALLHHFSAFDSDQRESIIYRLLACILPESYSPGEKETHRKRLQELFYCYRALCSLAYPAVEESTVRQQPPLDQEKILARLISYFPVSDDEAFQSTLTLLQKVAHFNELLNYFTKSGIRFSDRFGALKLKIQGLDEWLYQNSKTQYNIRFWLKGFIEEFDYHRYCYYYFLLNKAERKEFNKKAKTVMGAEIKQSMLKKRVPWELIESREDGISIYESTWRSIWFMDGKIRICTSRNPEFSEPFPWYFSEEKINFLYEYISGKRMNPLTVYARENTIVQVEGLEALENIIFKAELEREVKTGQKWSRGEGSNRIPINMLLRNQCIQYLNRLQLQGLEPFRILERSFNPERSSLTVDVSLLFQVPLQNGEVALIWESLELEKSKATHIFKCPEEEREWLQYKIETHLSTKSKVRSSLNSRDPEEIVEQQRLRYHGRVDHDNFDFSVWQSRLHTLLPALIAKKHSIEEE